MNVIDFKTRRPIEQTEIPKPIEESGKDQPDQKMVDKLSAELEGITLQEVLEHPGRDLDALTFENAEYLDPAYIGKLVFQEISKVLEASGELPEGKREMLSIFVQLFDDYATKVRKCILVMEEDFDPATMSQRVNDLEEQIREKKVKLLSDELGDKVVQMVRSTREFVDNGLDSDDWKRELDERHKTINPSHGGAQEFLRRAALVNSIDIVDDKSEGTVSLGNRRVVRDIKNVAKAYDDPEQDPARVVREGNHFWNTAGAIERDHRQEVRHLQALQDIDFIREQIKVKLVRDRIRAVPAADKSR